MFPLVSLGCIEKICENKYSQCKLEYSTENQMQIKFMNYKSKLDYQFPNNLDTFQGRVQRISIKWTTPPHQGCLIT